MPKLEIFDPAMCCSTGVCGPSVDPELIRISNELKALEKQGVEVARYNLSQEIKAFADNPVVKQLLDQEGTGILPITLVDGQVKKKKVYPTSAELNSWFNTDDASNSLITPQVRELIALGASVAANCLPCFRQHYNQLRKMGVSKEDMIVAVETGATVKSTAARQVIELAEKYLLEQSGCCGGGSDCC